MQMAEDQAAVVQEMSVSARIGGGPIGVTLVSTAHAMSHAYGALLPLIIPSFITDLQLTYTQVGLIFSLSNLVWSPLQLGFGVLGRYCSRKLMLGVGHICQGVAIIGTSLAHGFGDLLIATVGWRSTLVLFGLPGVLIGILLVGLLEEQRPRYHQGQRAAGIGTEVWALLKHREALLLLTSHVI